MKLRGVKTFFFQNTPTPKTGTVPKNQGQIITAWYEEFSTTEVHTRVRNPKHHRIQTFFTVTM